MIAHVSIENFVWFTLAVKASGTVINWSDRLINLRSWVVSLPTRERNLSSLCSTWPVAMWGILLGNFSLSPRLPRLNFVLWIFKGLVFFLFLPRSFIPRAPPRSKFRFVVVRWFLFYGFPLGVYPYRFPFKSSTLISLVGGSLWQQEIKSLDFV